MPDDDVDSSLDTEAKPLQHGEPSSTRRTLFNTANLLQHGEPSSTRRTLFNTANPPNQTLRTKPSEPEEAKKPKRLDQWLHNWRDGLRKQKKFAELARCEDHTKEKEKEISYWKKVDEEYAKQLEEEYWSKIEEDYWKEHKKKKPATELLEVRKIGPRTNRV